MKVNVEKFVSKRTMSLLIAIVLLIAGALFCISPAIGEGVAGLMIGIGVLLLGVIFALKDFLLEKTLISKGVLMGAVIAALGIYFIADGSIVSKIIGIIPYVLLVTGSCIVADSMLLKFVRDKSNTKKFVIELVIGIAVIVLGSLILSLGFFRKALAVIIGILMIAGSVYYLLGIFKKAPAEKQEAQENKPEAKEKPEKSKSTKKTK